MAFENNISAYEQELDASMAFVQKYPKGVTIFGSARTYEGEPDYELARELGAELAKNDILVATGGGGGIMEAANRGAREAGGESIGLNIILPTEQKLNVYTTAHYTFDYFFIRKQCLFDISRAYVYFPGGFGTLDELTEVVVQVQTKKLKPMPIILFDSKFWEPLVDMIDSRLLKNNMISEADTKLIQVVDSIDEVIDIVRANT